MKLSKNIGTWIANLCFAMILAVSGLVHGQPADIAGKIEIPARIPKLDTTNYYYDAIELEHGHYLHNIHVAIRVTLEHYVRGRLSFALSSMPVTLRVANFDADLKSCADRDLSTDAANTIQLEETGVEFGEYYHIHEFQDCKPYICRDNLCTMDCWSNKKVKKRKRDEIVSYEGRNHAGQLFRFKWRYLIYGKVNNIPLSSFTLTDSESGDTFEKAPITNPFHAIPWLPWPVEKQPTQWQHKIAAHFCD